MFSGIRYILGYTDETDATPTDGLAANQTNSAAGPGTVLEQTLNAATTKFTEQLLPQQSSIEQLQSSSHQLLPSIKEQHEENELKKKVNLDEAVEAIQFEAADEDDLFVADSWELLDLNENVEDQSATCASRSSSVQNDTTSSGMQKSTSGILKSNNASASDPSSQQSRHKPKVSFETPDLVSGKQEIEQTKATDAVSSSSKKGKSKKSKRSSRANVGERKTENQQAAPMNAGSAKVNYGTDKSGNNLKPTEKLDEENPSLIVGTKTTESTPFEMIVAEPIQPTTLNYAKALSAKPKSDVAKKMNVVKEAVEKIVEDNVEEKANKPMKRNRPMSTSSWSSGDEIETVKQQCAAPSENSAALEQSNVDWCIDEEDDKLSLASSGFSDCDYGYGCISDYVMRPKKVATRRNRTQSGSSGSFRAPKVARGHNTKHAGAASVESSSAQGECSKGVAKKPVGTKASVDSSTLVKNCRPRKKKLILTSPSKGSNVIDFLKPQANDKVAKTQPSKFLEPKLAKQQPQQSPASSSNDSNEIPEMDESWYVTPPPCFTGANKQRSTSTDGQQPRVVDAARENALIEHPSIYISSSSKSVADGGASTSRIKKTRRKLHSSIEAAKKARDQLKDLLDGWGIDAQEEAESDFDSMFEPAKKRKSKGKQRQQKLEAQRAKPGTNDRAVVEDTDSDEQCSESVNDIKRNLIEGSNSVELISIRSLSMENSLNIENEGANLFSNGDNKSEETATKPQRRQATKVCPIEPERRPGWQLKKQRSKRRPLASLNIDNKLQSTAAKSSNPSSSNVKVESPASTASSSRSTPTFMDRLGSSIVANLTNLTSGLVSSGALNSSSHVVGSSPLIDRSERVQQTVANLSKECNLSGLNARKQLSRGSLKRQNVTAQQANMQRRPDRRLKMFANPNGSSVNRKVHANIH